MNKYDGIRLGDSSACTLTNNTCLNNAHGVFLRDSSNCTIESNTFSENGVGIYLPSSSRDNTAHYNNIYNNTACGINATDNDGFTINATKNYWGAASGPYHPTKNPGGGGDNITDYVEFDPWLDEAVNSPPMAHIDYISPNPSVEGERIRFEGHGTDDGSIIGYAWRSSIDDEFYSGADSEIEYDELSNGIHTIYFKVQDNWGIWSDEVSTTLTITEYIPPNQNPTITITSPANNTRVSGTVTIAGSANDPDGLVRKVEISINNGEWKNVTGIDPTGTDPWSYEWDTSAMTDGDYDIKIRAYDGEEYSEILVWNLEVKNDDGGDDDDDDSPGFGAGVALLAVSLVCAGVFVFGRRNLK